MIQKFNHRGFTLFELMISMVIFAGLMTSILESVGNITIARTRTMNRITLLEELYFFSENLASAIKDGGIIDYEEYWNRQVVGTTTGTGHYAKATGFGNYGSGGDLGSNYGNFYYFCRSGDVSASWNTVRVGTGWCMTTNNSKGDGASPDANYSWKYQRYGEYKLQFTDYNGNADSDSGGISVWLGDEDLNGTIIWDEDDKDIGDGPTVFSGATPELYLINPLTHERTYFRWTYKDDPGLPIGTCIIATWSGCLGNIEILKLQGKDIGMKSHTGDTTNDSSAFDGDIDTWICHPDWSCRDGVDVSPYGWLPTWADSEWVKIFPDYVNVKQISFTLFPQKDPWKSWAAPDSLPPSTEVSPFIHPYVRIQLTMGLAWSKRSVIKWDDPTISISTTISLTGESQ